jgi:putative phosphoesterase
MRVAALYDIHGNYPALQAVLHHLEKEKPDLIVIGGDIVSGPMPLQTLERLFRIETEVRFIRGNCDREVVTAYDGRPLRPDMSEAGRATTEWVAKQLQPSHRHFLSQLPLTYTHSLDGHGDVLFCHATPHSDEEIFTPLTPKETLMTLFHGVGEKTVICGHTHIQFAHRIGETLILNSGSVGMPYADRPGAYWLLLGPDGYEFRRTEYDFEAAAKEIRESSAPQAIQFAEENVRQVPTAAQAMEVFERIARNKQ